jgi:hypothetical protein
MLCVLTGLPSFYSRVLYLYDVIHVEIFRNEQDGIMLWYLSIFIPQHNDSQGRCSTPLQNEVFETRSIDLL